MAEEYLKNTTEDAIDVDRGKEESGALVKFTDVTFSYDVVTDGEDGEESEATKVCALSDVSFSVGEGEFVAVIGRNGSGKSTLAKLMNALLIPDAGTVVVEGIDTADDKMIWEVRTRVGMVFQNPDNQIIGATVEEDIAFGLENIGMPRDEMIGRIAWAAETVGLSDRQLKKEPHAMSGGQKQRVAVAGILAMRPKCIVLDEATAMLDPVGRREVMKITRELNREHGLTIVHITHHMDEVVQADRVIVIDNGSVAASGTPRELFSQPEMMKKWGLEAPQVTSLAHALKNAGVNIKDDVLNTDEALPEFIGLLKNHADPAVNTEEAMKAREERRYAASSPYVFKEGPNSVGVSGLAYIYSPGTPFEHEAIRDVSFSAGDGEFIGIIGHTGCGKSTLVQHLNGLLKPSEGTVTIGGETMSGSGVKTMRRRVGLVFQYPEYQLFESTVAKDVAFGIRKDGLSEEETAERVNAALRAVGLDESIREKSIYDLSGGQKRRVAIAGILVMKPGILVLDEPAAGLDPEGREEILGICAGLRAKEGTTVILVSHSMDDVARLCDRVLVMNHGGVEMFAAPDEVFEKEERMTELGLTVPQLSVLFRRLNDVLPEIHVSRKIYSVEAGFDEIMSLLGRGGDGTLTAPEVVAADGPEERSGGTAGEGEGAAEQ